jgi:sec-independent protein translocase protein TatB
MFDIGFTELIVIGVVALIVIGPERLPKVARTAGHLYGRLQRYVSTVKSDISQEIQMEELRRAGQEFKNSIDSAASGAERQATVVDDYLRNEVAQVTQAAAIAMPESDGDATPAAKKPLMAAPNLAGQSPQQSLLLDEPDQNAHEPAARHETAAGDNPDKPA